MKRSSIVMQQRNPFNTAWWLRFYKSSPFKKTRYFNFLEQMIVVSHIHRNHYVDAFQMFGIIICRGTNEKGRVKIDMCFLNKKIAFFSHSRSHCSLQRVSKRVLNTFWLVSIQKMKIFQICHSFACRHSLTNLNCNRHGNCFDRRTCWAKHAVCAFFLFW